LAAGCAKVCQEKVFGARTDRAELAKVLKRIEPGDMLSGSPMAKASWTSRALTALIRPRSDGCKALSTEARPPREAPAEIDVAATGHNCGLTRFSVRLLPERTSGCG
jgi:hypothetical protein